MTGIHRYASPGGCMYCSAPGTETGNPCPTAAEVERDWTARVGGDYDPIQHLRALVGTLRRRDPAWTLEHTATTAGGTPCERYVVRRGEEEIARGESVVRELAAREAGAGLWRWRKLQSR